MSKKSAALSSAVARYNVECKALIKMRKPDCPIPAPQLLPTTLTELKACTSLMESVWVTEVDETQHRWVREPEVRESIRAMHKVDRCQEEVARLAREADNQLRWFCREIEALVKAMDDPKSKRFRPSVHRYATGFGADETYCYVDADLLPVLKQEYETISSLRFEWGTIFVPERRYVQAHATLTSRGAEKLTWLTPVFGGNDNHNGHTGTYTGDVCVDHDDEDDVGDNDDDAATVCQPDEACLEDFIEEVCEDGHEETRTLSGGAHTSLKAPQEADDHVEMMSGPHANSGAPSRSAPLVLPGTTTFKWHHLEHIPVRSLCDLLCYYLIALQCPIQEDTDLFEALELPFIEPHSPDAQRRLRAGPTRVVAAFGPDEYKRLSRPNSWLSDTCINELTSLLHHHLARQSDHMDNAGRCAVFNSYMLNLAQTGPDRLWSQSRRLEYWLKDIWLIPVHRPTAQHWVLAVALPSQCRVLLFDSFADQEAWQMDVPVRFRERVSMAHLTLHNINRKSSMPSSASRCLRPHMGTVSNSGKPGMSNQSL